MKKVTFYLLFLVISLVSCSVEDTENLNKPQDSSELKAPEAILKVTFNSTLGAEIKKELANVFVFSKVEILDVYHEVWFVPQNHVGDIIEVCMMYKALDTIELLSVESYRTDNTGGTKDDDEEDTSDEEERTDNTGGTKDDDDDDTSDEEERNMTIDNTVKSKKTSIRFPLK